MISPLGGTVKAQLAREVKFPSRFRPLLFRGGFTARKQTAASVHAPCPWAADAPGTGDGATTGSRVLLRDSDAPWGAA